jgi:quinol monooxygenase YgiN
LSYSTEILIATLAYTQPNKDTDAQTHLRLINDKLRQTTGLITLHFYRSRDRQPSYLILSTWEDEACWKHAQERSDPRTFLLTRPDLLATLPEQWCLHYCWGYSRPARKRSISTAYILTVPTPKLELACASCLQELRHLAHHYPLASGLLATGTTDMPPKQMTFNSILKTLYSEQKAQANILLSLISWSSSGEQAPFHNLGVHQQLNTKLGLANRSTTLTLEPF